MKNKQHGFIIPLIIVIIAALAIGGGAYVYSHNKDNSKAKKETYNNLGTQNSSEKNKEQNTSITVGSTTSVNATLNLKTYSDKYFTFKYPSDWTVSNNVDGDIFINPPHPISKEDYITLTGIQADCEPNIPHTKCVVITKEPKITLSTYSKNPNTLLVFTKVQSSLSYHP